MRVERITMHLRIFSVRSCAYGKPFRLKLQASFAIHNSSLAATPTRQSTSMEHTRNGQSHTGQQLAEAKRFWEMLVDGVEPLQFWEGAQIVPSAFQGESFIHCPSFHVTHEEIGCGDSSYVAVWALAVSRYCNVAEFAMTVARVDGVNRPGVYPVRCNFGKEQQHDILAGVSSWCSEGKEYAIFLTDLDAVTWKDAVQSAGHCSFVWALDEQSAGSAASHLRQHFLTKIQLVLWHEDKEVHGCLVIHKSLFSQSLACLLQGAVSRLASCLKLHAGSAQCEAWPILGEAELVEADISSYDSSWNFLGALDEYPLVCARVWQHCNNSEQPAIRAPDGNLTWSELGSMAALVASFLQKEGIRPGSLVGLAIEPSTWTAVATLGTWLAGCGYVPMDPGLPTERLNFIASNAKVAVVLTTSQFAEKMLQAAAFPTHLLDRLAMNEDAQVFTYADIDPDSVAYVIFTSGSTGNPKGVPISHRALLSHVVCVAEALGLNSEDDCLQGASFMFDAHILELWPALWAAASVVISKKDGVVDSEYYRDLVVRESISSAFLVPSVLSALVDELGATTLRNLLVGGEATSLELYKAVREKINPEKLINLYGPTEVTVSSHSFAPNPDQMLSDARMSLPIGKPLAWRQHFVLDAWQGLSLSGVGELVLTGPGLAWNCAYIDLPEVSAKHFVPLPAQLAALPSVKSHPQALNQNGCPMMYRTGDLVRTLQSGDLEFVGRIDHQVKIRGLRIELGEIEEAIRGASSVTEVLVLVLKETLVAYISGNWEQEAVFECCSRSLPRYMVPQAWVHVEKWPRTVSGKIDRKALPAMYEEFLSSAATAHEVEDASESTPPTATEALVLSVFRQVLSLGDGALSAHSNFFTCGGTSLSAARVVASIRREFGFDLKFAEIYSAPTAKQLARLIDISCESSFRKTREAAPSLPELVPQPRQTAGKTLASPGQQQMLALFEMQPESPAYNVPLLLRFAGPLDVAAFARALGLVAARHDVMRTNVDRSLAGQVEQIIYDPNDFWFPAYRWQAGFGLTCVNEAAWTRSRTRSTVGRGSSTSGDMTRRRGSSISSSMTRRRGSSISSSMTWRRGHSLLSDLSVQSANNDLPTLQQENSLCFLSGIPAGNDEESLREWLLREAAVPFDLAGAPLIRLIMAETDTSGSHLVLLNFHHAIFDGSSVNVLGRELSHFYRTCCASDQIEAEGLLAEFGPPLAAQYSDFSHWQLEVLPASQERGRQLIYWQEQLGEVPRLQLPSDLRRPSKLEDHGGRVQVHLDKTTSTRLREVAAAAGTTIYSALFAMYSLFLGRVCSTSDVLVGSAWHGRTHAVSEEMIGFFVNTVMLRMKLEGLSSLEDLLASAHQVVLGAFNNSTVPFNDVLEACGCTENPVVADFSFLDASWSEAGRSESFQFEGMTTERVEIAIPCSAKFELALELGELESGCIHGHFEYNAQLFTPWRAADLAKQFQELVQNVLQGGKEAVLSRLEILPAADNAVVKNWEAEAWPSLSLNDTAPPLVTELFLQAVKRYPRSRAAELGSESMSYAELGAWAADLAVELQGAGIGRESVVAVLLGRSFETLVALWGILLAGAAYVSIDAGYPAERVQSILEDVEPKALITSRNRAERLENVPAMVIDCELLQGGLAPMAQQKMRKAEPFRPQDLAYIVFSSGSTGRPKGSAIEHGSLANEIMSNGSFMRLNNGDRVFQFHNPAFDAAVPELLGVICHGATAVLWRADDNFADKVAECKVNKLTMTPSALSELDPTAVRLDVLGVGAEALPLQLAKTWAGKVEMWNFYGPSECTVDSTATRVSLQEEAIHIGRPLPNTSAYILHGNVRQPAGILGELCVGGVQVGRGYVKRPELTNEKFTEDPFVPGGRMYRTGDLATWTEEGNIRFVGRLDFQVKIRGFRVEPGEVETALGDLGCTTAVVLVEHEQLVAFVTPVQETQPLRRDLALRLPAYFVPSHIVAMHELPRTANGKFCRKALREAYHEHLAARSEHTTFVAARTPLEQTLVDSTREVLQVDVLSIDENLKLAGMTSLRTMRLVMRLRSAGVYLSTADLYGASCIRELTDLLESRQQKDNEHTAGQPVVTKRTEGRLPCARHLGSMISRVLTPAGRGCVQLAAWLWIAAVILFPVAPAYHFGAGWVNSHSLLTASRLPWYRMLLEILCVGCVSWPLYVIFLMIAVVISKWLIVGRYEEGIYPIGSMMWLRWWAFDRLFSFANENCLATLSGGRIYSCFLNLMGVRGVWKMRAMMSASVTEFDLVELGTGSCVLEGARLKAAVFENGCLVLRRCRVGDGAVLGEGASLLAGADLPNGAQLAPMTSVSSRDDLRSQPAVKVWWGVPAQPAPQHYVQNILPEPLAKMSNVMLDFLGMSLTGLVTALASLVFWPMIGAGVNQVLVTFTEVSDFDWWNESAGFQLSAIVMVFGPTILPYADVLCGSPALIRGYSILREKLKSNGLQAVWVAVELLLVAALSIHTVTLGVLVVIFYWALRCFKVSRPSQLLLRVGFYRCFSLFNGTWAAAAWLRLLGAHVALSAKITMKRLPDKLELLEHLAVGEHSVLMNPVFAGFIASSSATSKEKDGEVLPRTRNRNAIAIGKNCLVEGSMLFPGAVVADGGVVQGSCLASSLDAGVSVVAWPPVFGKPVKLAAGQCAELGWCHRVAIRLCHLLFPAVSISFTNLVFMLSLLALDLVANTFENGYLIAKDHTLHYGSALLYAPLFFLVFGLSAGIISVPLKWLIRWADVEAVGSGRFDTVWRPHQSLTNYRRQISSWIYTLAMEEFMMLTAGTQLYNWWLQAQGVKVASDAMVLAPVESFDLISIGSRAVVDKEVSLSTCRLLPCPAPYHFAERHTKVSIGADAALAEGSAVIAADVGESSICAEGTVIGPDTTLPPRTFVFGSTATRYRWDQGRA